MSEIGGVVLVMIIFCAASFIVAPIVQHQAIADGYGMCAGGRHHLPSTYFGISVAKNLTEQNYNVAGMPRETFDRFYPVPANVLIESMTINIRGAILI